MAPATSVGFDVHGARRDKPRSCAGLPCSQWWQPVVVEAARAGRTFWILTALSARPWCGGESGPWGQAGPVLVRSVTPWLCAGCLPASVSPSVKDMWQRPGPGCIQRQSQEHPHLPPCLPPMAGRPAAHEPRISQAPVPVSPQVSLRRPPGRNSCSGHCPTALSCSLLPSTWSSMGCHTWPSADGGLGPASQQPCFTALDTLHSHLRLSLPVPQEFRPWPRPQPLLQCLLQGCTTQVPSTPPVLLTAAPASITTVRPGPTQGLACFVAPPLQTAYHPAPTGPSWREENISGAQRGGWGEECIRGQPLAPSPALCTQGGLNPVGGPGPRGVLGQGWSPPPTRLQQHVGLHRQLLADGRLLSLGTRLLVPQGTAPLRVHPRRSCPVLIRSHVRTDLFSVEVLQ